MKKILLILFIILTSISFFFLGLSLNSFFKSTPTKKSPLATITPKPLEVYSIENLSQNSSLKGTLSISEEPLKDEEKFASYKFRLEFTPKPENKETKITSGLINIPQGKEKTPLIILIRGYVDQELYQTGMGTTRAGEYFSQNGFVTLALDFLGYADSDTESENIFETRFQTYTATLSLLRAIEDSSLPTLLKEKWDNKNIFIWAHSNGGQIALTTLVITAKPYPTTLWAPVTKPFPYSILYYLDEAEDRGKLIRSELANFEDLYDVEKYSFDNYLDQIKAPLQIHQGTADDAVPLTWSQEFSKKLKNQEIENQLFVYPGADHNLQPSWETVISRDIDFFNKNKE